MKGGFPNESHNYEEFQLEVSRDIENLKANMEGVPNEIQRWWINIRDTMLYMFIPRIFPGQGDDVDVDYVNVLCIIVGKYIIDKYVNITNGQSIEETNRNTLNLPIKTDRDFIEFLQILLKFSKTTKHFAENNRYDNIQNEYENPLDIAVMLKYENDYSVLYTHDFISILRIINWYINYNYTNPDIRSKLDPLPYSCVDTYDVYDNTELTKLVDEYMHINSTSDAIEFVKEKFLYDMTDKEDDEILDELKTKLLSFTNTQALDDLKNLVNRENFVTILKDLIKNFNKVFIQYLFMKTCIDQENAEMMGVENRDIYIYDTLTDFKLTYYMEIMQIILKDKYETLEEYYRNETDELDNDLVDVLDCIEEYIDENKIYLNPNPNTPPDVKLFHLYTRDRRLEQLSRLYDEDDIEEKLEKYEVNEYLYNIYNEIKDRLSLYDSEDNMELYNSRTLFQGLFYLSVRTLKHIVDEIYKILIDNNVVGSNNYIGYDYETLQKYNETITLKLAKNRSDRESYEKFSFLGSDWIDERRRKDAYVWSIQRTLESLEEIQKVLIHSGGSNHRIESAFRKIINLVAKEFKKPDGNFYVEYEKISQLERVKGEKPMVKILKEFRDDKDQGYKVYHYDYVDKNLERYGLEDFNERMENEAYEPGAPKVKMKDIEHLKNNPDLPQEYLAYLRSIQKGVGEFDKDDRPPYMRDSLYSSRKDRDFDIKEYRDMLKNRYKTNPPQLESELFSKLGIKNEPENIREILEKSDNLYRSARTRGNTPLQSRHELRRSILQNTDNSRFRNITRALDLERDRRLTMRRPYGRVTRLGRVREMGEPLVSSDSSSDPYGLYGMMGNI